MQGIGGYLHLQAEHTLEERDGAELGGNKDCRDHNSLN